MSTSVHFFNSCRALVKPMLKGARAAIRWLGRKHACTSMRPEPAGYDLPYLMGRCETGVIATGRHVFSSPLDGC